MAEPNNTPRPLSPATETTPLLTTGMGESSTQHQSPEEAVQPPSSEAAEASVSNPGFVRSTKALTHISLLGSAICLLLIFTTLFTSAFAPTRSYSPPEPQVALIFLAIVIIASTILSYLNLSAIRQSALAGPQRTSFFSPFFTLFLDLLLVLFICNFTGILIDQSMESWYACHSSDCKRWMLALSILCDIIIGIAFAIGLVHFILFILRCITTFRTGLGPSTFPTGQFTVEFTVKLLKQETRGGS